jgi:hypothetical protein
MDKLKDFLNPKSMLTPGIAGGIAMMIANTLWIQFELPQKWTALVISFLLGTLLFLAKETPVWQRIIYYLLNSLIIISVGAGTNTIGSGLSKPMSQPSEHSIIRHFKISTAYADPSSIAVGAENKDREKPKKKTQEETASSATNTKEKTGQTEKTTIPDKNPKKTEDRKFFQTWF